MKVSNLQLFLRSLRSAVTGADPHSAVAEQLEAVNTGLEPFAGLDFGQFAAFLRQAQQYRDTGAVTVPPSAGPGAEKVQTALRGAASLAEMLSSGVGLDGHHFSPQRDRARQELEQALATFLQPLGIGVTFKDDHKGFESALRSARMRGLAAQVRAVLQGVTDEESLNAPERQDKLRAILDPLETADLKALATELGATASGRKEALLAAITERVTGIKPAAKKAVRGTRTAAVDQAKVQREAVKLKGLLENSVDPDGLSDAEVDAAVGELKSLKEAELRAVVQEAGLENAGTKKADILKKVRLKLTEARRARESIQV